MAELWVAVLLGVATVEIKHLKIENLYYKLTFLSKCKMVE